MIDYRSSFHMPQGTYLNCSYMSPLLRAVEEAGIAGIHGRRDPAAISPEKFFEESNEVRHLLGQLIHADPERIVMIPSVSYGMANVVRNVSLKPGQEILLAAEQFPSNYYPWQRLAESTGAKLVVAGPDPSADSRGKSWNENILENIRPETGIVAISNVHWADGTRFDLMKIREKSREAGALLFIDGTQSVGALPFNVEDIQPDALVCAGYKWLMGPYSLGFAWYGPAFDNGIPVEENWINRKNSENFTALINYQDDYQPGALRYEVGEHSNFVLVPMFHAALKKILEWTPEFIQSYCKELIADPVATIRELGYAVDSEPYRASHIFGIRLPAETDSHKLKSLLQEENIVVSFRGDAIRIAPNIYNTGEDLRHLVRVLKQALKPAYSL